MRELNDFFSRVYPPEEQVVKLDVGGVLFTTSVHTLRKYPDSLLALLFSAQHKLNRNDSDYVFLDRNGKIFGYVLDWLRR